MDPTITHPHSVTSFSLESHNGELFPLVDTEKPILVNWKTNFKLKVNNSIPSNNELTLISNNVVVNRCTNEEKPKASVETLTIQGFTGWNKFGGKLFSHTIVGCYYVRVRYGGLNYELAFTVRSKISETTGNTLFYYLADFQSSQKHYAEKWQENIIIPPPPPPEEETTSNNKRKKDSNYKKADYESPNKRKKKNTKHIDDQIDEPNDSVHQSSLLTFANVPWSDALNYYPSPISSGKEPSNETIINNNDCDDSFLPGYLDCESSPQQSSAPFLQSELVDFFKENDLFFYDENGMQC